MCECDDAALPHGSLRDGHVHRRRFLQGAGAGAVMLIGGRILNATPVGAQGNAGSDGGEDSGSKAAPATRLLQRAPINVPPPIIIPGLAGALTRRSARLIAPSLRSRS